MKQLIVNGDDYGATKGINQGILEVAQRGILTSTSVMVNRPYASEIKDFKRLCPKIGIGVHFDFPDDLIKRYNAGQHIEEAEILQELEKQITKFKEVAGFNPDHMDFHKVAVRPTKTFAVKDISVFKNPVEKISSKYNLPWRGMENIIVIDQFHGVTYDSITHKKLQTDLTKISPDALINILRSLNDGVYELMTHPGYVDNETTSSYAIERETEVKTLTNSTVLRALKKFEINLINYSQI